MKLPTRATSTTPAELLARLCRAELVGDVKLRASPTATSAITTEQRDELLRKCAAGEYVEIVVDFLAYEQATGSINRNAIRFKDGAMAKLAKSGRGVPLLRDHEADDLLARAGTILESTLERPADGTYQIRQSARVTAPWAVDAFLRGNIDRFSIHARPTGPVLCSACGCEVMGDCWHFPGDTIDGKDGEDCCTVEWIFTSAELVESSAVSVPAVASAHLENMRAAMLAARDHTTAERNPPAPEASPMTMIALALMTAAFGLPSTSTPDEVAAHARNQTARLATLEAANGEQTRRLAAQEVQLAAVREATLARELEDFVAGLVAEGKLIPGGPTDKSLRAYFATDAAGARALASTLPRVTPAGAGRQSGPTVIPPAGAGSGAGPGPVEPGGEQLAAVNAEIIAQGARPAGVLRVLRAFGGDGEAKLAKHGPAAFGLNANGSR